MLNNKIRILLVVRWPVGGIRTYMRYVFNNFDTRRYSFTLIAPNLSEIPALLEDLRQIDLKFVMVDQNASASDFLMVILHTLKTHKHDIIHSHGLTAGLCSILPSYLYNIPHLLTVHDVFTSKQFDRKKGLLQRIFLSAVVPLITKIHAVSFDVKANLLEHIPTLRLGGSKIVPILNGIEIDRFIGVNRIHFRKDMNLSNNTFLIGFLGRFMSQKGFIYLIESLGLLKSKYKLEKDPVLLTFGEGAFIREEKIYVESKGLQHSVHFLPFVPNIAPVLKGLDLVVMPSLWEACGLLAMEAMVAGTPLIGTDCIGLREVLKGTPCKTVPIKDSEALADAIAHEIFNPSKLTAEQFSVEAAGRFDVRKHSKELEKLISRLLP
jgi:glycosyltransferase involved in cell wall biosynthesis